MLFGVSLGSLVPLCSSCQWPRSIGKSESQINNQQHARRALTRNNLGNSKVKPGESMAADFGRAKMLFIDAAIARDVAVEEKERVDTLLLSGETRASWLVELRTLTSSVSMKHYEIPRPDNMLVKD
jgi:hypothetical protein